MLKIEIDRRKLQELLHQSVNILVECIAAARKVINDCAHNSVECTPALENYQERCKECISKARASIKQCKVYDQEYDLLIEDEDLRSCIEELETCIKLLEAALNACGVQQVTKECLKLSQKSIEECEEGIDACKRLLNMRDDLA